MVGWLAPWWVGGWVAADGWLCMVVGWCPQVRAAYEELDSEKADVFETQFPDNTAAVYVAMMRQGRDKWPQEVLEAADKWAALNRAEVAEQESQVMQELAAGFEKQFPVETAVKAAEVIEGLGTTTSGSGPAGQGSGC